MASSTSTASASLSQGPGSKPPCMGWSPGSEARLAQNSTTGIANRSAKSASTCQPAPRLATISGRSAADNAAAPSAIVAGSGRPWDTGFWRGSGERRKPGSGSAMTSRGMVK